MFGKRLASLAFVLVGLSWATPSHAIDIVKGGKNTTGEGSSYRRNFGADRYRGTHEATRLGEADKIEKGKKEFGGKIAKYDPFGKIGSKEPTTAEEKEAAEADGCRGSWKALSGEVSAKVGWQEKDGKSRQGVKGDKGTGLACSVGTDNALITGKVECLKQLAGDKNLGVNVKGGVNGGAVANAACHCDGPQVVCEAFIGLKAGADGTVGGQLCGLRLGVGIGGDVGAGAGGKIAIGKSSKGWGFSIAGYFGVGGGLSVAIDPDFGALFDSKKRAETLACLKQKARASLAWLDNVMTKVGEAQIAAAGGGAFLAP